MKERLDDCFVGIDMAARMMARPYRCSVLFFAQPQPDPSFSWFDAKLRCVGPTGSLP